MTQKMHPQNTGPDYLDEYLDKPLLVRCPDCGQMEWWTVEEQADHGWCRSATAPCPLCANQADAAESSPQAR